MIFINNWIFHSWIKFFCVSSRSRLFLPRARARVSSGTSVVQEPESPKKSAGSATMYRSHNFLLFAKVWKICNEQFLTEAKYIPKFKLYPEGKQILKRLHVLTFVVKTPSLVGVVLVILYKWVCRYFLWVPVCLLVSFWATSRAGQTQKC